MMGDVNLMLAQELNELTNEDQLIIPLDTAETEPQNENVLGSQSPATSQADEDVASYESTSASISAEDSQMLSTSESVSESQEFISTSMTNEIADVEQQVTSMSASYSEKGYDREGLAEQEAIVTVAEGIVNNALETISTGEDLQLPRGGVVHTDHVLNTQNFYNNEVARNLAKELIKYKLLQDGAITVEEQKYLAIQWVNGEGGYSGKYFLVQYIHDTDEGLKYHEDYFDYVTANQEGNSLYKDPSVEKLTYVNNAGQTKKVEPDDLASNVSGINVIQKLYTFTEERLMKDKGLPTERAFNYVINRYTNPDGTVSKLEFERKVVSFARDQDNKILKGTDYYKYTTYKEDVENRKTMPNMIDSLSNYAQDVRIALGEYVNTASESAALWNLASLNRAESLSISQEGSQMLSQSKSESRLSSTSESLSTSESESISASASESTARVVTQTSTNDTSASVTAMPAPVTLNENLQEPQPQVVNQTEARPERQYRAQPARVEIIDDEAVPLAVIDGEEASGSISSKETFDKDKNTTRIIDEQVAKSAISGKENKHFIWYILAIIAGFFGLRKLEKSLKEKAEK